jgi:hypothetical protein
MPLQDLNTWCRDLIIDSETENVQRRDINSNEFQQGWLRLDTISTQQLNQLFYILTSYSNRVITQVYFVDSAKPIPNTVIKADGGSFLEEDAPLLFEIYKGTMPNFINAAPAGTTPVMNKI